jgi:cytochrome c553
MRTARRVFFAALCALALTAFHADSSAGAGPLDSPGYTKAAACSACHGLGGNSRSETMPVLAGMAPWYLKKTIDDYASGARPAAEMEPFAKLVKELGPDDVANYFAAQAREPSPVKLDAAAVERGRAAAAACAACHGPAGKGDAARRVPDITGQPAGYLKIQMDRFKAETRNPKDTELKQMKAVMKGIPDPTLADLAAYYASLR